MKKAINVRFVPVNPVKLTALLSVTLALPPNVVRFKLVALVLIGPMP